MKASGCTYNGGICHEIVEQCEGCGRKTQYSAGWYCSACPDPGLKWKVNKCNMATHVAAANTQASAKINPLKASKRGNRR